jgi:acyl carrier protein
MMNDHWIRFTSCSALALLLFSTATGCDRGPRTPSGPEAVPGPVAVSGPVAELRVRDRAMSTDEAAIIAIMEKQLGKEPGEIQSSTSLKDLGADELDLISVVMELETKFHVMIAKGAIEKAAGAATMDSKLKALTASKFAALVEEARHTPQSPVTPPPKDVSGEVGTDHAKTAP